jgi:protoheme IX farnesyltransferase
MALTSVELTHRPSIASHVGAYVALTKPRIIELLLVTTLPTMIVARRGIPSPWLMVATLLGGTFAAGGANAINMFVDRDIDKVMHRTRNRPLVTGAMAPRNALIFAVSLEGIAFAELWAWVNPLSAVLAVTATLFYVFVYTLWLKRRSSQNIVIGGAAGAFPPIIGWAAVTGSIDLVPVLMFAIIFFWTPPHFWSLSLYASGDYERAGVPMLPVVSGPRITRANIVAYTMALMPVAASPWAVGFVGWPYLVLSLILTGIFLYHALLVLGDGRGPNGASLTHNAPARKAFRYSLLYLFLLFAVLAICRLAA